MSAHREAAAQFSRALRFATDRPVTERAELHDLLADELFVIEDWQQSDVERSRAVELWRESGDRLRLGDSLRRLGRARYSMYERDGKSLIEESIAVLEELPPSAPLAWAYSNMAGALMYADPPRAIECAQHARKVLEMSGAEDPGLISDALNSEGCALNALGESSTELLEEALRVALAANAPQQATRAYNNLVATRLNLSQFQDSLRYAELGIAYGEEHDMALYLHCLMGVYIALLDKLGRWDEALEVAEHELLKPTLSPFNRAGPLLTAGSIRARRGEREVGAPLLAEATAVYNDMGCNEDNLRQVELAWLDGNLAEAHARATALASTPGLAAEVSCELAVWLRRVGANVDDYDLVLDQVRARQLTEPWQDVVAMWADLGSPYEQALALYDSGEEGAMREAIAILDRLGATAAVNVVRAEMRHRGYTAIPRGVRNATRADRFGLTRRQREVLDLMAEGLTNVDISRRLFLSERTVEHHVAAVLEKLGVDSRRDAARLAAGAGALEASST